MSSKQGESKRRGRPSGSKKLNEDVVTRVAGLMEEGLRFTDAVRASGIPLRTAYSWRERGERLASEFLDDLDSVPKDQRIFLHFLHEVEAARARCITNLVQLAHRKIRSTSDALKLLEYVCPEEYGRAARRRAAEPVEMDMNREICRIVQEVADLHAQSMRNVPSEIDAPGPTTESTLVSQS